MILQAANSEGVGLLFRAISTIGWTIMLPLDNTWLVMEELCGVES